jgi:hypothetical protein
MKPSRPFKIGRITVNRYTSLYIRKNQVELRLGTFMEVYSGNIDLTYS